jgi:hypothetical protein
MKPNPATFQICGLAGLALGVAVGVGLVVQLGLSLRVLGIVAAVAVATFLAVAMAAKVLVGEEVLVYYHHQLAILAAVTAVLWAMSQQPILPYLDVTILGVGAFLVLGRVGCFMVGCCHGRPHALGVRYGERHADAGFPDNLVGVRLFPIQLVESLWVLLTVTVGIGLVLGGAAPGRALAWYVVAYGAGRFVLEFARGDASRPYVAGFSEAQWTSLVLMLTVVAAGIGGVIPVQPWHGLVTAGVPSVMVGVAVRRRLDDTARYSLLAPTHISEVAGAVRLLTARGNLAVDAKTLQTLVNVTTTSQGIHLSTGVWETAEGSVRHYTLSRSGKRLLLGEARALADLFTLVTGRTERVELLPSRSGVFHLLVPLRKADVVSANRQADR